MVKHGLRDLAISGICLLLIVSVFSGCSKKIEGKWKKDPSDVKGVERISHTMYGDPPEISFGVEIPMVQGELYDNLKPIFMDRLILIYLLEYSNGEKTLYISMRMSERVMMRGADDEVYQMCKNKEPITEEIKTSFRDYASCIKKFHEEVLKNFDPKEYVQIQIELRNLDKIALFTFNATENGEYSWEPIKIVGTRFEKDIPYDEMPKDWLEVLDEDKFFTQNYARGEEPEYVE